MAPPYTHTHTHCTHTPCFLQCYIVATKHGGSLKGEHGTGRNVAPYVEMEWGTKVECIECFAVYKVLCCV